MSKLTLALDLGTSLGWADSNGGCGCKDLSEKGDIKSCRWVNFRDFLETSAPDVIYFEQINFGARGAKAAVVYGGLLATLETYAFEHSTPTLGVTPGEIKKHATGSGNANKTKMVAAAARKWPDVDITTDDVADALWLIDYAVGGER